ncbi:recombinase family protein, partial [Escherichia coli]|uniref:recombinase family protein n=2 Tax=Escherichia coli TaxID=562 RepID=UPI002021F1AA
MTSNVPTSFVRAYLRASTAEQDASRALETIEAFARERGLIICSYYIENESGTRLERPELFRLLRDCQQNDILLIEDVDRLSRLSGEDWNTLKKMIRQKDIRVMAVNVPTTWIMNRPGFPGECFICELRLPDHRFRWKHNKLFLLL